MEGSETYALLVQEIGEEAARKVFRLFAGSSVNFPKRVTRVFRDAEIVERFDRGQSYERLSRAYGLSPQQIRNITSHAGRQHNRDLQSELFD